MCAMVTIEIHRHKQRSLSLVIYGLLGLFDANIRRKTLYQIEANIELYFMVWFKSYLSTFSKILTLLVVCIRIYVATYHELQ